MQQVRRWKPWQAFAGILIVLASVLLPTSAGTDRLAASPSHPPRYAPGIILAQPKSTQNSARIATIAGATSVSPLGHLGVQELHVPPGQEQATIQRLQQSGSVNFAELDYYSTAAFVPNDPLYPNQWALPKIDAPTAWQTTFGSPSVTVAVIDTGFDFNHPDRPVNLVAGPTFVSAPMPTCPPEGQNGPQDDQGHGTHVTGIIAAHTNNALGVAGIAPNVTILVIKAGDCTGSFLDSDIATAIQYAADHGARVIDMSFGGTGDSQTMDLAIQYAWSKGVVLVAAAGNDGMNEAFFPADYQHVIAVSATDPTDGLATFSNYGPSITVAAPGVNIVSLMSSTNVFGCSEYCTLSGTSMAAPFVSGVAGLLLSVKPSLTNTQVVDAIEQGAIPLGSGCPNPFFGYGRVDAARSLQSIADPTLTSSAAPYAYRFYFPLVAVAPCAPPTY